MSWSENLFEFLSTFQLNRNSHSFQQTRNPIKNVAAESIATATAPTKSAIRHDVVTYLWSMEIAMVNTFLFSLWRDFHWIFPTENLLARMNDLIALVKKLEKDIYNQHGDIRRLQSLIENCAGCWELSLKFTCVNTHENHEVVGPNDVYLTQTSFNSSNFIIIL
jgi:hypothetical protein